MKFQKTISIDTTPSVADRAVADCFSQLKVAYADEDDIRRSRFSYEEKLRALCADIESGKISGDPIHALTRHGPFGLAYQGHNDRKLQADYGHFLCRLMARRFPTTSLPPPPKTGDAVRVGLVGGFFLQHSIWKVLIKGWLTQLDRKRFKLFGYHTSKNRDSETEIAAGLCQRFVQGPLSLDDWHREILHDAPHILIFPGINMDRVATLLAATRLAPVQCNSWGHPETSGMPTVDYFLSSDLMEPHDAADHYTEQLVRLPNLSVYYEPTDPKPITVTRQQPGLRPDATVFWCGQSIIKYLPRFDDVFPRIAKEVGNCQFVFSRRFGSVEENDLFQRRLDGAFARRGLSASDHCVALETLTSDEFSAALGLSDIFLDSIEWSGCTTTLESLAYNLPIVTMPGAFMRGRHTAAILNMMRVTETIASSIDDYVAIAARIAKNANERRALSLKIAANKHRVYRDSLCIAALEDFLDRAVRT